ncbi:MAG: DegQ family serine endoprotease [Deltaproteobacteria bacterium]|nr:DegQ family serine endoprotease [Deltaproteobacteria bacterium]
MTAVILTGFMSLFLFGNHLEALADTAGIDKSIPGSFSNLFKNAKDSVVNISTIKVVKGGARLFRGGPLNPNDPFNDFFERFFKDQVPREYRQRSLGSGFIIDKEGFILTNNHVVEQTDAITVKLADGDEYDAKIIGRDPKTDLALIQIEAKEPLKALEFGDSDALAVGDWVVAIGNPFGLDHTVTAGIVSAKYRNIGAGSYDNFIQTDASINPGNSGGPLIDTSGKVVGINSAIFSQSGGSVGIGFAIPINMAKDLLPQLKSGKVIRGWLGVIIQEITPDLKDKLGLEDESGALVGDVTTGGPADKAGILRGDVVVTFDGKKIKDMKELPLIVANTQVGKVVEVEVIRKGKKLTIDVKISELMEEDEKEEPSVEETDLGMIVEEITPQMARQYNLPADSGMIITQVEEGSAGEEAGLRRGDIILEIDQAPVKTLSEYRDKISKYKKNDTILFLIKRQDATIYLTLKVRE